MLTFSRQTPAFQYLWANTGSGGQRSQVLGAEQTPERWQARFAGPMCVRRLAGLAAEGKFAPGRLCRCCPKTAPRPCCSTAAGCPPSSGRVPGRALPAAGPSTALPPFAPSERRAARPATRSRCP